MSSVGSGEPPTSIADPHPARPDRRHNRVMVRPAIAAVALVISAAAWSVLLAFAPEPFSEGSAILLGTDLLLVTVVAVAGVLLARARWALRLTIAIVATEVVLAAVVGLDSAWPAASTTVAAAAAVAAIARAHWLRRLPSADGPPPQAVVLLIGLVALPGWAALMVPSGLGPIHWVAAAAGPVLALLLGRGGPLGLWLGRLLLPLLGGAAVAFSPMPGRVGLAAAVIILGGLSWSRAVARSAVALLPQRARGYPIPPELVPPEVFEAAGLDERGRPRR